MTIKIPESYLVTIDKLILKFRWRKKTRIINKKLKKRNKVGGLTVPVFKMYCKDTVTKPGIGGRTNRLTEQNREDRNRHISLIN
jgi:hypothetical protein